MIIRERYKDTVMRMTHFMFPDAPLEAVDRALDWSIDKRYKEEQATIVNNYTKRETTENLDALTEYILRRQPILTPYGVMFKRPGTEPVPLLNMMKSFMDLRGIHKSQMFEYEKGTDEYNHYFLLQLLDKIDANGTYGAMLQASCLLCNTFVSGSITAQGRALIATATMFFESFLSNGVKFASLDEVIQFIDCVCMERPDRKFKDSDMLDRNISKEECFAKIVLSIGDFKRGKVKWYPTEDDLDIIWHIIARLDQEDLNRLYYKNNLYAFMENKSATNALVYLLTKLEKPFLTPTEVPEEIEFELDAFTDIMREYVMYNHHWIDAADRCDNMIKNVTLLSDTDSAIVCLETWRQFMTDKVKGVDLKILHQEVDEKKYLEKDPTAVEEVEYETVLDYNFYKEEIIEVEKACKPHTIIPAENLRYSIINIAAYILTKLANEYIEGYTHRNFSYDPGRKCFLYLKNEFLFKMVLMTNAKKHYASKIELQEGHFVPEEESLDIKGLDIKKSTLNAKAKEELEKILYDEVLNADKIDQVRIVKRLAILERQIYNSLESGSKEFYKPLQIKSMNSYDDPMGIQGVKASVIWNMVRGEGLPAIDLESRNRIDIVKVSITRENAGKIRTIYPEAYGNLINAFDSLELSEYERAKERARKKGKDPSKVKPCSIEITALAIPMDVETPKWVLEFIDYASIINDCLTNFPIESVGIPKMNNNSVNYTNIISI